MPKKEEKKRTSSKKTHKFDAWHVGGVFAYYNFALIVALLLLAVVTVQFLPVWVYIIIVAPIAFTVFWLWFSQRILHAYRTVSLHDALVITKLSVVPFAVLFLIGILGSYATFYSIETSLWLKGLYYYCSMIGASSVFLGFAVVFFGLRHRITVKSLKT